MESTIRKLTMADGTEIGLTLNFKALYELKQRDEQTYERYNDIRMNGIKDEFCFADVLYTAHLCVDQPHMDKMDFYTLLPENRNTITEAVSGLLYGAKKKKGL